MKYLIENITFAADAEVDISEYILQKYEIKPVSYILDKKSIDARNKNNVKILFRIIAEVDQSDEQKCKKYGFKKLPEKEKTVRQLKKINKKVIIIGSGPAGLFAALKLNENGFDVEIFERGKKVEERLNDIKILGKEGILDCESNVLFGEGGAGTWSDGKLTTRINKPEIETVFDTFVKYGADSSILYESKPHIGSDRLSAMLKNLRSDSEKNGVKFSFHTKITDFIRSENAVKGVIDSNGKEYFADSVILATGHSARDMYELLLKSGITMSKKAFAVGVRVEHPAEFINRAQYGRFHKNLDAADYRLTYNNPQNKRGVFSFCMCPGGVVVNSSSEEGMLCVNGMSYSNRNLANSNSAIVVSVRPDDMDADVLSGIAFQRKIESNAFKEKFFAPAQTMCDFLNIKNPNFKTSQTSYKPGIYEADFKDLLPDFIINDLKNGMMNFEKKIRGFIENSIIVGVETRTSSPVRIDRRPDGQSESYDNLYPIGEGAGYAGGIVSSAVDGIKCANLICERYPFVTA